MRNRDTDKKMVQYLLGELSENESERIERQYLADPDYYDELLGVEDDLMDEYARGELQGRRRERFERLRLATPRQRERLRDAHILMKRLDAATVPASPDIKQRERDSWFSFLNQRKLAALPVACATLVLLVAIGWLALQTARLQQQVERMRAEQSAAERREQEMREQLAAEHKAREELLRQLQEDRDLSEPNDQKDRVSPEKLIEPRAVTFMLALPLVRGGEASSFVVPRGVEIVRMEIQVADGPYNSYRTDVQTADGELVYQQSGLRAAPAQSGRVLAFNIPSRLLRGRDYVMKVSGQSLDGNFEDAGLYSFRILRK